MARAPYILDGRGFATKIKNARGQNWRSDASIACPNCNYTIDNTDVPQDWPGLPAGVKFDPSDQEIIKHLEQKLGRGNAEPHPFIEEFILTLKEESGICYTHPENLPGVKQDGSCIHVFHKTSKAYTTGHRKCRKITSEISSGGEVRWHKTGKTKPVMENGIQKGCKKIMVLYTSAKGSKAGKTNWVMHQYHLGTEEDEKEGEFVVSKVFYQQQTKQCEKSDPQVHREYAATSTSKGHPVTPNTSTPPLLLRSGKMHACLDVVKEEQMPWAVSPQAEYLDATIHQHSKGKDITYEIDDDFLNAQDDYELVCAGESQFYDDPQDLDSLLCSELFENQACQGTFKAESPMPDLSECGRIGGNESESRQKIVEAGNLMSSLPDYGYIGNHEHETGQSSGNHEPEKELIENNENNEPVCPALGNIVLDTPPDGPITFCGSQMSSQDSESLYQFTNPAI